VQKLTYKKSGVDIQTADIFKQKIKKMVKSSFRSEVLRDIGGFGSFFTFARHKYRKPVLVSSADGVGTKLKVAILAHRHDTVGIDAVAMNVNDILCTGAEPLFFLDYVAYSSLKEGVLVDIVSGINRGCIEAGCSLVGGETAQMPGMYKTNEYDVAGFCVGVVERQNIIDGSGIEAGNVVVGMESNGLHSNGFSLVRRVFSESELRRMKDELLKPTRIYVKPVLSLLKDARYRRMIRGIAHITGGAFYDKIARILPKGVDARISKSAWPVPGVFRLIQNKGNIENKEMYHTFNMGIGMALIVAPNNTHAILARLTELKIKPWVIGEVVRGSGKVFVD